MSEGWCGDESGCGVLQRTVKGVWGSVLCLAVLEGVCTEEEMTENVLEMA